MTNLQTNMFFNCIGGTNWGLLFVKRPVQSSSSEGQNFLIVETYGLKNSNLYILIEIELSNSWFQNLPHCYF